MGWTTILSFNNDRIDTIRDNAQQVIEEITTCASGGNNGDLSYEVRVHSVAHRDNNVLIVQYGGRVYNLSQFSPDLDLLKDETREPTLFGDLVKYTEQEAQRLRTEFRQRVAQSKTAKKK